MCTTFLNSSLEDMFIDTRKWKEGERERERDRMPSLDSPTGIKPAAQVSVPMGN